MPRPYTCMYEYANTYTCVYIYMCVYIYTHTLKHMCICIFICVYTKNCIYIYMYICVHTHMSKYLYTYTCMYVCAIWNSTIFTLIARLYFTYTNHIKKTLTHYCQSLFRLLQYCRSGASESSFFKFLFEIAVKELNLSYYVGETILNTVKIHHKWFLVEKVITQEPYILHPPYAVEKKTLGAT